MQRFLPLVGVLVFACGPSSQPAAPSSRSQSGSSLSLQCPEFVRDGAPQHTEAFDKSCTSDSDCIAVVVGCACGPRRVVGINQKDHDRFATCDDCPAVQCALTPPTADDGKPVDLAKVQATCVAHACTASSPAQATESQSPPPAAVGAAFAVSDFGLVGNVPAGDKCTPTVLGSKLARLDCGTWAITLEVASAINDATVEGATNTATQAWSGAKNFKSQTLPEGWQLTFEATNAGAPEYHLKTYRSIAGKAYECDINAKSIAERDKAIAVCGSLKAKPH